MSKCRNLKKCDQTGEDNKMGKQSGFFFTEAKNNVTWLAKK